MIRFSLCLIQILLFLTVKVVCSQERFLFNRDQVELTRAQWIGSDETSGKTYAVLLFQKKFILDTVPKNVRINVSADNRYKLFVNGCTLHVGPALGSLERWFYDILDIAPYLQKGENTLAVKVWNFGEHNAQRQQSYKTAFILQAHNSHIGTLINTNDSWKVLRDQSYHPILLSDEEIGGGYIAYPTDSISLKGQLINWQQPISKDLKWKKPLSFGFGNEKGLNSWQTTPWELAPRTIPIFPDSLERNYEVRKTSGIKTKTMQNLKIAPFTKCTLLLDNHHLTMGYPTLSVSKGKKAIVKLIYQESLFDKADSKQKGNRNLITGKIMKGYRDVFVSSGAIDSISYTPLSLRTFRYVQVQIETFEKPLFINDFYNNFSAFPFKKTGGFTVPDTTLTKIMEASWRTARLCAHETYMDCPYYEQLQYIGDTRIQALISLYLTQNDELVKNAINQFNDSFSAVGLTQSRYPSNIKQIIPPFSMLYVHMLSDYHLLRNDPDFVAKNLKIVPMILKWFIDYLDEDFLINNIPYWNHTDGGAEGFEIGEPPFLNEKPNAQLALLLAYTIDVFLELDATFDLKIQAEYFKEISHSIKKNVYRLCYDSKRKLIAESPSKTVFTEHTNALAILAAVPRIDEVLTAEAIHEGDQIIAATSYHKFYTFQALAKVGKASLFLSELKPWKKALGYGLTTFPEHGVESRSDCHAWSAHLLYDFPAYIAGIRPSSTGFKTVLIKPQDDLLSKYEAKVSHPNGTIQMRKKDIFTYEVKLPEGLFGELHKNGEKFNLRPGLTMIRTD